MLKDFKKLVQAKPNNEPTSDKSHRMTAEITPLHLRTGSAPTKAKKLNPNMLVARGHLLAKVLGGHGGADNLVVLYQKANLDMLDQFETPIWAAMELRARSALATARKHRRPEFDIMAPENELYRDRVIVLMDASIEHIKMEAFWNGPKTNGEASVRPTHLECSAWGVLSISKTVENKWD